MEYEEYPCPDCSALVRVNGFYADTFGKDVDCPMCKAALRVAHECGWGTDEGCYTYLEHR